MNFQAEIANLSYEYAAIASRKVPPARVANRDILQLLNLLKQKNQHTTMTSDTYVRSDMHFSKKGIDVQAIQHQLGEEKYRIDKYIKERARDLNGILFSKIRDERSIPEYVMKYNDVIFLMHVESASQIRMTENVKDTFVMASYFVESHQLHKEDCRFFLQEVAGGESKDYNESSIDFR
jgi:hypothetical protein